MNGATLRFRVIGELPVKPFGHGRACGLGSNPHPELTAVQHTYLFLTEGARERSCRRATDATTCVGAQNEPSG